MTDVAVTDIDAALVALRFAVTAATVVTVVTAVNFAFIYTRILFLYTIKLHIKIKYYLFSIYNLVFYI